ncbi:MAG TPA: SDR family NAD(P)-dependent oxidoreductase [Candidatus Eisenbacteria bacterium]|nr:SDR family NAD(P)-dependent oxidoreductase [Candidatus Eisenbacteria bacterium]
MGFLSEGVAVITGAGSGMGRCLAQQLAAMGTSLAISDVNGKALAETAGMLGAAKGKVTQHVVNVAEEARMKAFAEEVEAQHGRATTLFNNAGVALLGNFEEISIADIRWLMDINFWGVIYGTHYFLPLLKREKRAHIVNLSSVFGLVGVVGQTAYCASKFAVRGFTESLRHELDGTNIFVTSVHPGGIRTDIARHARPGAKVGKDLYKNSVARFDRVAITTPEDAAARILQGVEKREGRVLIGKDCKQVDFLQRLKPASYWGTLAKKIEDPGATKR